MKAVYTYWPTGPGTLNGGFANLRDMAAMVTISICKLKENNPKILSVELYTNSAGKSVFPDRYPIPFDVVHTDLDQLPPSLNSNLWGFAKIFTYAAQNEPFIHLDLDVILWEPLPTRFFTDSCFFQNRENCSTHTGYDISYEKSKPYLPECIKEKPEWAYNCGIVGGLDLELFKEWKQAAELYILSPKNLNYWLGIADMHSQNHFFEQWFISSLIKSKKLNAGELLENFEYEMHQTKISHLWGDTKRDSESVTRIYNRLQRDYPEKYREIMAVDLDHTDVFESIYKTNLWGNRSGGGSSEDVTKDYVAFVDQVIKENAVKSIYDLGCGFFDFQKNIDLTGIQYIGGDCVASVINSNKLDNKRENVNFEVVDIRKIETLNFDLVMIKDVFIHWTNEEVKTFLLGLSGFKILMITNDNRTENGNVDIDRPGLYRDIDITQEPFNMPATVGMVWTSASKTTYLITAKQLKSWQNHLCLISTEQQTLQ